MFVRQSRLWLIVVVGLLLILAGWQAPYWLQTLPGRYLARLPQPIQQLAMAGQSDILPTAPAQADISFLLHPPTPPAAAISPTATAALLAPVITTGQAGAASPTPLPSETPTETPTVTPTPTAPSIPIPSQARLNGFRHTFQTWNNCGPATLSMALSYYEIYRSQHEIAAITKPHPEDRNVTPQEMVAYVEEHTDVSAIDRTNGSLPLVRRLLANGFPVIIELGINPPGEYRWMGWYGHYLLLVAYDDEREVFWVYDSWFGTSEAPGENATIDGREASYQELDAQWRAFNRHYITFFRPEERKRVETILGPQLDDQIMWQQALTRVQAELNQEADDPFLWFNLGTVYNALGDYEKAAAAFDQARSIGLPWRMLWYQFGPYEAYYQVGRYEEVILLANATLENRPYFEESFYYKGLAQAALGDPTAARQSINQAAGLNPNIILQSQRCQALEIC